MDTIELSDGSDSELSPQIVRSKSAKQQRPTPPVPVESSSGSKRRTVNDVAPFRASSCELQPISSRNNSNSGFRTSSDFLPIPVGTTSQTDENPRRTSTKRSTTSDNLPRIPTFASTKLLIKAKHFIDQPYSRTPLPSQDYARNYSTIHTLTQERDDLYRQRDKARLEAAAEKLLSDQSLRIQELVIRALKGSLSESDARIKGLEQEGKKKDRKIKALEAEAKKRKLEDENVSTKKIKLAVELEVKVKGGQIEGVVVNEE